LEVGLEALELCEELGGLLAVEFGGHGLIAVDEVVDRVAEFEFAVYLFGYLLPAHLGSAPAKAVDHCVDLALRGLHDI
jgi:hypothetical protein